MGQTSSSSTAAPAAGNGGDPTDALLLTAALSMGRADTAKLFLLKNAALVFHRDAASGDTPLHHAARAGGCGAGGGPAGLVRLVLATLRAAAASNT
jgi:hypothetical protein